MVPHEVIETNSLVEPGLRLTIRLRYAYDTLTIRLHMYDTLTILLRYAYDTLTILLRYSHYTLKYLDEISKTKSQKLEPKNNAFLFSQVSPMQCNRVQWESLEWQSTRGLRVEWSENNGNDPTSDQQKQLVSRLSFFLRCLPKFVKVSCM